MVSLTPVAVFLAAFIWLGWIARDFGPRTNRRLAGMILLLMLLSYVGAFGSS